MSEVSVVSSTHTSLPQPLASPPKAREVVKEGIANNSPTNFMGFAILQSCNIHSYQSTTSKQLRSLMDAKLVKAGERERLREYLRIRLVECGWRDELKAYCRDIVHSKGQEHVKLEDLVQEIMPKARSTVPDSLRSEMLTKIKTFLQEAD